MERKRGPLNFVFPFSMPKLTTTKFTLTELDFQWTSRGHEYHQFSRELEQQQNSRIRQKGQQTKSTHEK